MAQPVIEDLLIYIYILNVSHPGREQQKTQCALTFPNEEQPTSDTAMLNIKGNASVIDMGQESQLCGEKPVLIAVPRV